MSGFQSVVLSSFFLYFDRIFFAYFDVKRGKLEKSKSCLEIGKILERLLDKAINYTARLFAYLFILCNILVLSAIAFLLTIKSKNTHKLLQILMQNQLVSSL